MSRINEARHLCWHDTSTCKFRLDLSICDNEQRWNNNNKCRCECKYFFDKVRCNDGFIWNPNICKCECDKSCDAGEYLEYEKCKCIKKLTLECEDEILNTADTAQLLIKKSNM